jgi:hypothetical protein
MPGHLGARSAPELETRRGPNSVAIGSRCVEREDAVNVITDEAPGGAVDSGAPRPPCAACITDPLRG